MIALVTDSSSQLPPELAQRYRVKVVPVTVTLNGVDFLEGEDLDADAFYEAFEGGPAPVVKTSQPSPGRFAQAYQAATEDGATEILSIHLAADVSGTVNSARLAAALAPVAVRVVDTGTASFGVACCVWEAAEMLRRGATADEAEQLATELGPRIGNVFVVKALDLARAGGRLTGSSGAGGQEDEGHIPVLTLSNGSMEVLATVATVDAAAAAMAAHVRGAGSSLRVGIGVADAQAAPLGEALRNQLADGAEVREVVSYRVGPSVGAHTGPGTVGAVYYESG